MTRSVTDVVVIDVELRLERGADGWILAGGDANRFALVNEYLSYLSDRNYSPQTVRVYGFSLLAFCRWLTKEEIDLDAVNTDVLLRYLAACRQATVPGRPGPNVVRMDGRRADGYTPATVNNRLAAISVCSNSERCATPMRRTRSREAGKRDGSLLASATACSLTWHVVRDSDQHCEFENPSGCLVRWTLATSWHWWGVCGRGETGRWRD